jgi:hypothetical protein
LNPGQEVSASVSTASVDTTGRPVGEKA